MSDERAEMAKWDPGFTRQITNLGGSADPTILPRRGPRTVIPCLRQAAHSWSPTIPAACSLPTSSSSRRSSTRSSAIDRPLYTLAHYGVFIGPLGDLLRRAGVIEASRENAGDALRSGAVVLVFPGGDYDSYRPTLTANVVDFGGRTGYVRTAIETGVPIVPMVSIGAQETQMFLARGDSIARLIGFTKARMEILPVSFGFPFGLSVIFPPNFPLPSKIVTRCSIPSTSSRSSVRTRTSTRSTCTSGSVMQAALDELARERRFPVLG